MAPRGRGERFTDFMQYLADHPGGASAQRIADALGVHRRSVYRYRNRATALKFSIQDDGGTLRLVSPDREPLERGVVLSDLQIRLLLAATAGRTPHSPELRAVLDQLRAAQGTHGQREFRAASFLHLAQQDELPDGLLDRLVHAITARKTLQLTYRNGRGETRGYAFDPYGLLQRGDHLYLVGVNHNSRAAGYGQPQTLRLDGIEACALTREDFAAPDFDLRAYAQTSFGPFAVAGEPVAVRLHVSSEKAHAVARTRRHPSQRCTPQPDGSLLYELSVPLSLDLVSWVVSYAGHIRVLEPPELVEQVLAHVRAVQVGQEAVTGNLQAGGEVNP